MSPRARRGGHGHSNGGGPLPREVTVSKAMSFVLRHGAEKEGIKLDAQGYANVADLLAWHKLRKLQVTLSELQSIVAHNDKQRFALISAPSASSNGAGDGGGSASQTPSHSSSSSAASSSNDDPSTYRIRATQGHSIRTLTSTSLALTPLTSSTAPRSIVHGTFPAAWRLILASGALRRMGRNHIHFAADVPGKGKDKDNERGNGEGEGEGEVVISGMRRDASVLVWVDVQKAMAVGGLRFWRSENGVVLSEGDGEGKVGLEFVERVVQRNLGREGERVLWEGGRVVAEVVGGEGKGVGKGKRGGARGGGDGRRERRAATDGDGDADATSASPSTTVNGTHASDTGVIAIAGPPGTITAT